MEYKKVYVGATVNFLPSGIMLPKIIHWEDGENYKIDSVAKITPAASMKVGGQGDRYTILINGLERYIYFERNASLNGNNIGKWFVEGII